MVKQLSLLGFSIILIFSVFGGHIYADSPYPPNIKRITETPWITKSKPRMHQNIVVWKEIDFDHSGEASVYMYDLTIGVKTKLSNASPSDVSIFGNKIVWADTEGLNLYDTITKSKIIVGHGIIDSPIIYENKIVYQYRLQTTSGWISQIKLFNIDTAEESIISDYPSEKFNPTINGNKVSWEDWRNGSSDIYLFDITSKEEKRITDQGFNVLPSIFENTLIWRNQINGSGTQPTITSVYNTMSDKLTSIEGFLGSSPAIHGDKVLLYKQINPVAPSLFLHNLTDGYESEVKPFISNSYINDPALYEDKIAYVMGNNSEQDIYVQYIDPSHSADQIPPITKYKAMPNWGYVNGGMTIKSYKITLTAADDMSGVKQTWYKVNDGAWLLYSTPFIVNDLRTVVNYYSEDNAGNKETVH